MPKKTVTLTPGMQDLISTVNARYANAQEAAAEAGDTPLLGQIFNAGSDFVADRVGEVVAGGAYILNTMDLTRQWVAQPLLGAMVATVAGQWGEVESYSDLRRIWDESKVPGPVKFFAEMGMDPLLWTGWGWAHTAPIKFAKALTPLAMGGKRAGLAGRALETVVNPARILTQRTYQIGKAEFAFSGRARRAITALSKGELKGPRDIANLVEESVKLGYVADNASSIRQATEMIRQGTGSFGRALGPGWVARLANPLRMGRLLSPVDVLFENMWMAPFGAAAPLLVPAAKTGGMLAVKAIDAAGKTFPMKSALWLGARVGPEIGHNAYAAASQGKLASWVFQPTTHSLEREATRVMGRVRTMFGEAAGDPLRLAPDEVLSAFRFGQDDVIRRIPLDNDTKSILRAVLEPTDIMTDDLFQRLVVGATDERQVLDGIHLTVQQHLRRNLVSLEKLDPTSLTAVNRFWGWTQGLVNKWKPWVTSRMPHFWPLNTIDNIGRGGTGLTKASMNEVRDYMVRHGYPEDLATHVTPSVYELMKKGMVAPADLAAMALGKRTALVGGEKIVLEAAPLTQLGIEQATKKGQTSFGFLDRVGRNMHAGVLRQDQNAQLALAELGTQRGLLREIMTAPVEDDVYRLRQFIEAKRAEATFNPALLDEMEKIAVKAVDDPAGMARVVGEKFNLPTIHLNEVENSRWFNTMPEGWQDAFKAEWEVAQAEGVPSIQALVGAANKADGQLPRFLGTRKLKYVEDLTHREDLLDGIFADMGVTGLKAARKETHRAVRNTLQGIRKVLEETDPKAAAYFKGRMGPIADAVRQMDHVTYSNVAQAAQGNGMTSQFVLPAFESWNQRMPRMIAERITKLADEMDIYRGAMQGGQELAAKESLTRMSRHHGDFGDLLRRPEMPLPEMVEQQFRVTSERVWNQFIGSKFEIADGLVAMYQRGKVLDKDIAALAQKATKDIFRLGNVAERNERWAGILSKWSETEGRMIPVNTRMRQQEIFARRRELKTEIQNRVPFGQELEGAAKKDPALQALLEEEATLTAEYTALRTPRADVEKRLEEVRNVMWDQRQAERHLGRTVSPEIDALREEERRLLALLGDPAGTGPVRPIEEMYRDFLNNYEQLGHSIVNAAVSTNPTESLRIYRSASAQLRGKLLKMSVNETQDLHGIKMIQEYFEQIMGLSKDQRLKLRLANMTRNAVKRDGIPFMRQRMVDYTQQINVHEIVGSFLPFAAFQLHMPGYLARSFMERPGYIQMMNHFAQSAEENFGVTGGMSMGGGFVFAPHLRFSYLPILAGNNFVRGDDHPLNQLNDMLSLFGFSPGPNVMIAADLMNQFASKSGFNEKLGLDQAAPEFRGGLLPHMRFVQDITAMMGIDSGKDLNIPWIGPSVDIREREVKRELAGRLSGRIEAFRERNGRDPYPDEVTAMRESVLANEITDARREVAARDFPAAFIPGLKPHDPEYTRIRERAAAWMTTQGIEKVTAKNVVSNYRKLTKFQKTALTRMIPEFGDVLAVPPFQESGQAKTVRQAREGFFRNRDLVMATTAQEQRKLDTALEEGTLNPVEYRHMRSSLRGKMSAGLDALEQNPDFLPFITMERQAPTQPEEMAYMDYQKMEPRDANQNGIIDEEDMKLFFDARRAYLLNQSPWVRDYIRTRRELQMTPTEIEFTRAQTTLNDFFDVPKYIGLTLEEGEIADKVLSEARVLARVAPGRTSLIEVVMAMPNVDDQGRVLALRALRAGRNPQRFAFWTSHAEDLDTWYPDLKPANPLE